MSRFDLAAAMLLSGGIGVCVVAFGAGVVAALISSGEGYCYSDDVATFLQMQGLPAIDKRACDAHWLSVRY